MDFPVHPDPNESLFSGPVEELLELPFPTPDQGGEHFDPGPLLHVQEAGHDLGG